MNLQRIGKICGAMAMHYSEETFRTPRVVADALQALLAVPEEEALRLALIAWELKVLAINKTARTMLH